MAGAASAVAVALSSQLIAVCENLDQEWGSMKAKLCIHEATRGSLHYSSELHQGRVVFCSMAHEARVEDGQCSQITVTSEERILYELSEKPK